MHLNEISKSDIKPLVSVVLEDEREGEVAAIELHQSLEPRARNLTLVVRRGNGLIHERGVTAAELKRLIRSHR